MRKTLWVFSDLITIAILIPFQDWSKILNTNMTGSSTNAEDFTKQFMSEMFGNNGAGKF